MACLMAGHSRKARGIQASTGAGKDSVVPHSSCFGGPSTQHRQRSDPADNHLHVLPRCIRLTMVSTERNLRHEYLIHECIHVDVCDRYPELPFVSCIAGWTTGREWSSLSSQGLEVNGHGLIMMCREKPVNLRLLKRTCDAQLCAKVYNRSHRTSDPRGIPAATVHP